MVNECNQIKKRYKKEKIKLVIIQIFVLIAFIGLWEVLANVGILNEFLFSKPSSIFSLLIKYTKSNEIFKHIKISVYETLLGLFIGTISGIFIASILWYFIGLRKVLNPFLNVLNALPKTALAPIMIIWAGTGVSGIVVVAISILIVITILSALNYFIHVDEEKITMLKSFKASKLQIFTKLILPSNARNLFSIIKINIGMSWIGVIVGEFLVSRNGIGYLIMYGGQVFRLDLVMMGVLILSICAFLMCTIVEKIEKYIFRERKGKI